MAFLTGHKRRRDAIIAILAVLSLALVMTGYAQNQRVAALTIQVNATYQKALYEAGELMGGVQLGLEKLMVSGSGAHEQALLTDITRQSDGARDNLSLLPPGEQALEGAIKFINQVGDYSRVLGEKLAAGGILSPENLVQLAALHASCVSLNQQLAEMIVALEQGDLTFETDRSALEALGNRPEEETDPLVEYPALLYDGPFSDARETGAVKVAGAPVTAERAGELLRQYVGAERVSRLTQLGESTILSECYEFELETESGTLSAGVTKAGGHVLYMLPNNTLANVTLSQAECIDLGARFLSAREYGEMAVSYWRQQGGILTVNYAAVQDGILLYPDLVKLQINMENGLIVGVEAANYLRNHERRALPYPVLTAEDAMARISPALTIEQVRLCVIPLDAGEAQCWEITAQFEGGNRYLIYLDAETGEERTILQLRLSDEGIVTQ